MTICCRAILLAAARAGALDHLMALERQDFGVPPTSRLPAGPVCAPTPGSIPGDQEPGFFVWGRLIIC